MIPQFAASSGVKVSSATAEVTGATEITFNVEVSPASYAGIEWGVSPDYTWSAFSAFLGNDHEIIIDAADGVVDGTTYAWRSYATNDPLDALGNRVYGIGGTILVESTSPEAAAVIAAMSPAPSAPRQAAIEALVDTLIANGIWTKLDRLWVLAAHNDGSSGGTNGRINWIAPGTDNLGVSGTPTWTENEGYTGGSGHLTSATNLSAMTNFVEGSATVFAWVLSGSDATPVIGTNTSSNVFLRPSAGAEFGSRVNSTGTLNATNTTVPGLFSSVRKASGAGTAVEAYINGVSVVTDNRDSAAVAAEPITILRALSTNTTNQVSVGGLGSQLSDAENTNLETALETYLTAVGALP